MLFEGSRFLTTTPYSTHDDVVVLSRRRRKKYNQATSQMYTVIQGDTLDNISFRMYNTTALWWVILDANPKYQTELEIKPGDSLIIPSYDEAVNII